MGKETALREKNEIHIRTGRLRQTDRRQLGKKKREASGLSHQRDPNADNRKGKSLKNNSGM